jgi:hypothetical protein
VDLPNVTSIINQAFAASYKLKTLILRSNTVCQLVHSNALVATDINWGSGSIFVPDELVESYKSATNWSTYAAKIKPLSELEE